MACRIAAIERIELFKIEFVTACIINGNDISGDIKTGSDQ